MDARRGRRLSRSLARAANGYVLLPSYEQVRDDKAAFVEATRLIHLNTNPFNAATLVQYHDRQAVVVNPPASR